MTKLAIDSNAKGMQVLRPTSTEDVAVSTSAASNTAVSSNVRVQRVVCDVDVFYSLTGTATTTDVFLPARTVEFVHVYSGDQLSFITASGSGTAYVTDMV